MKGFNDWLHHNDGERYEGLREEFFEAGGEPGEFLDWAEAKYRDELEADAERKAAPPPTKYPSYGLQISTDSFRNELYHYRDAVEAFATACEQIELVKGDGYGQEVRDRVQAYFDSSLVRRDQAARTLAELVSAAAKAADPQTKN
ncbi:hypothetical protein [Pseudomonas psychrophila]|uniref:Uncharacterized protein n=1 Tax=Pseudomonas psychrophila TaxID=122355 RepID=A0A8I1FVS9_9PSED|nr:hypothetical protein [Pseudomonas psychrophila]AVX93340.1 hypothetical protein PkP19E3_35195 [Pseudomonas koreensis]MBJ2259703.1 hypothetical protein [Pseudomonas psychrophila]